MSIEANAPPVLVSNNRTEAASPPPESYYGSKLVQALAEYSGRFRSEFKLNESDTKYTQATVSNATASGNAPAPSPQVAAPHGFRGAAYTAPRTASGQNITPGGNPSTLHKGMGLRKRARIESAARLCATGLYTDKMIAEFLGITAPYLSVLKTTKEFQSASIECLSGVLSDANQNMLNSVEARRAELASMVTSALLQLRNLALSRNQNVALRAVQEILDRDGQLAKVSKSSVELKTPEDMDAANKTASDIMDVLRSVSHLQPNSIQADPASVGGIAPGFTVSAARAKEQITSMNEQINATTLEEIDTASSTVQ